MLGGGGGGGGGSRQAHGSGMYSVETGELHLLACSLVDALCVLYSGGATGRSTNDPQSIKKSNDWLVAFKKGKPAACVATSVLVLRAVHALGSFSTPQASRDRSIFAVRIPRTSPHHSISRSSSKRNIDILRAGAHRRMPEMPSSHDARWCHLCERRGTYPRVRCGRRPKAKSCQPRGCAGPSRSSRYDPSSSTQTAFSEMSSAALALRAHDTREHYQPHGARGARDAARCMQR